MCAFLPERLTTIIHPFKPKGWTNQYSAVTPHLVTQWVYSFTSKCACGELCVYKKQRFYILSTKANLSVILLCRFDCVIPHGGPEVLLNQNVSQGDRGSHIYMQRGRHPYAALSHDYMPLKRYCSFCLVGKHLSRDVTLTADKDSDLCIILSVNTSHTAPWYKVKALKTNALP